MKPPIRYPAGALSLFIALLMLNGCSPEAPGTWKNDQIDAAKRKDFNELNDQAFKYIKAGDVKRLQYLVSKDQIDDPGLNRKAHRLGNYLNADDYTLLDEYYVINKWKDRDTITNPGKGAKTYDLYYAGKTREMYIALFIPKKGSEQWMITFIYGKYDYGWKIAEFNLAQYTFNGKTAAEIFKKAQDEQAHHYFNETTLELAMKCLRPNGMWRYRCDTLVRDEYQKSVMEANEHYTFPFVVKEVPTHPAIFRIFNQTNDEGTYPMIYYVSTIKVTDAAGIKKENDALKKVIGKILPGIDVTNNYLYFSVMNERPTGQKAIGHVDIDVKLR